MINFVSQNVRFKNALIPAVLASTSSSQKQSVLKMVVDRTLKESPQSNRLGMRLQFILLRSLAMSAEMTKELTKLKFVEQIQDKL